METTITTTSSGTSKDAEASQDGPGESSTQDEKSTNSRKRPPPPEPLPKSTRPTRAVKATRRAYSPPLPSTPSTSSRRVTRPTNRSKPPPAQPTPPPVVTPQVIMIKPAKEAVSKSNKEFVKRKLSTIEGQIELIHRATNDRKFAHALVNSLNQHTDKVVDSVRAKRQKGKSKSLTKALQLQEMKNSKRIDLNTPESVLTSVSLPSIINRKNFEKLPSYYQYRLTQLLPKCDQTLLPNDVVTPSDTAFNNEFFSRALASFHYRLGEGRLTNETMAKLKREMEREKKNLDPLKVKYFEPYFKEPEDSPKKCEEKQEKQFNRDLSFLQTMANCFKVVRSLCHSNSLAQPINSIRSSTVQFNESVTRSTDGLNRHIEPLNDTTAGTSLKAPPKWSTATASSTKVNSSPEFPTLPKEKKSDVQIEVLDYFEQRHFEKQYLFAQQPAPTRIILTPRQEPLFRFSTGTSPNGQVAFIDGQAVMLDSQSTSASQAGQPLQPVSPFHNHQLPQSVLTSSDSAFNVKGPRAKPNRAVAVKPECSPLKPLPTPPAVNVVSLTSRHVLPAAIIRHLPTCTPGRNNNMDWSNYIQSMYFIFLLLKKFLEQVELHRGNYGKLHLACKVIFQPMEYLCNGCSTFLKMVIKLPKFPNIPIVQNRCELVEVPDEVKKNLQAIEHQPNESFGQLNSDDPSDSDPYLNQINVSTLQRMLVKGQDLVQNHFEAIMKQFLAKGPFQVTDHMEFIRKTNSYREFCTESLDMILSNPLEPPSGPQQLIRLETAVSLA